MTNLAIWMSTNKLICLQWNARGLTKSRLEELRTLLNSHDPDIVFLSEPHWKKFFQVKFRNYSTLKKDRNNRRGGGEALLIKKSLQFSASSTFASRTLEVIGAIIHSTSGPVNCLSVYAPRGYCQAEEFTSLVSNSTPFILAGDLNAHIVYGNRTPQRMWQEKPSPQP